RWPLPSDWPALRMGRLSKIVVTMPDPVTAVAFTPAGDMLRAIHLPGYGAPAIHLSGLGCDSATSWSNVATRRGKNALVVDLPGHGRSDAPQDLDYTLPTLASAVATFIVAQQRGHAEILGHSLGGAVAVHLAGIRPDLVRRLILVEPALDPLPLRTGDIAAHREDELRNGGWRHILERESPSR